MSSEVGTRDSSWETGEAAVSSVVGAGLRRAGGHADGGVKTDADGSVKTDAAAVVKVEAVPDAGAPGACTAAAV